jgi:hypothetical protein
MVASLAAIVFELIRYNLFQQDGLSLGLVGSGFSFTSINFFWSPEFISAFRSKSSIAKQKWLLLLLIVSTILASTVGPSSAVLFVPSQAWSNVGGTQYYLKGTQDQLWPMQLTINNTGGTACRAGTYNPENDWCMCGGFQSLQGHLASHTRLPPDDGPFDVFMNDRGPNRMISGTFPVNSSGAEIWAYAPHAAATWIAQSNLDNWNIAASLVKGSKAVYKSLGTYSVFTILPNPVSRVVCGPLQNLTSGNQTAVPSHLCK